jgi:hypothetical protein
MSALAIIGIVVVVLALALIAYLALFRGNRRQDAIEDERIETAEEAVLPGHPDFDAPFERPRDPGDGPL